MIGLGKIYGRLFEAFDQGIVHEVNDVMMVWVPSIKEHVPDGFVIPNWEGGSGYDDMKRIEQIFEVVRKRRFPDRPKRLGSTFVFPSRRQAEKWTEPMSTYGDMHDVSVSGKVFFAKHTIYSDALEFMGEESAHIDDIVRLAKKYWTGCSSDDIDAEAILDGQAAVVRKSVESDDVLSQKRERNR